MPISVDGVAIPQETVDKYVMPKVIPGQLVRFWRSGVRDGNSAIAVVVAVAPRQLSVRTTTGYSSPDCRHADDPKLLLHKDQRDGGCWDYTDDHYADREWRASVDDRIQKLMDSVARLTVSAVRSSEDEQQKEKKPTGFAQIAALRREAAALGVDVPKDGTMEELRELIEAAKASK